MEEIFSDVFMMVVYGYAAVKGAALLYRRRGRAVKAAEGSLLAMDISDLMKVAMVSSKKTLEMGVSESVEVEVR